MKAKFHLTMHSRRVQYEDITDLFESAIISDSDGGEIALVKKPMPQNPENP